MRLVASLARAPNQITGTIGNNKGLVAGGVVLSVGCSGGESPILPLSGACCSGTRAGKCSHLVDGDGEVQVLGGRSP